MDEIKRAEELVKTVQRSGGASLRMDSEGRRIDAEPMLPKICVISFPKAGTHLALLLVAALAAPQTRVGEEKDDGKPPGIWVGTFRNNAFSDEWIYKIRTLAIINGQQPGTWMKGHCGYTERIRDAFLDAGTSVVFNYRDLRDVAVSIVYHIEGSEEQFAHAERDLYMALPTHEDRLLAVINGLGKDPGLVARWELYAPWLDVDWILPVRFEDILANKREAAEKTIQYVIKRTAEHRGVIPMILKEQYDVMVKQALRFMDSPKEYSVTYRKGKSGGWRQEFTPKVMEAFDATGGNVWLKKLGYEE